MNTGTVLPAPKRVPRKQSYPTLPWPRKKEPPIIAYPFDPRNVSHVFTCKNVYRACEGAVGGEDPCAGGYDGPWRMFLRGAGGAARALPLCALLANEISGGGEGRV